MQLDQMSCLCLLILFAFSCSEVSLHLADSLGVGLQCWFAQWVFYTQLLLMFLSASGKVKLPCKPLSTFRERCSGEMPGNSTNQSRWGHPLSLGALGRERKPDNGFFLGCGPKMPLPE